MLAFGFAFVQQERSAGHFNQELLPNCISSLQVLVRNYVLKVILSTSGKIFFFLMEIIKVIAQGFGKESVQQTGHKFPQLRAGDVLGISILMCYSKLTCGL